MMRKQAREEVISELQNNKKGELLLSEVRL